jgi:hypothetical protein
MQTFLPYPSFIQSAKSLDYRRLGKQRVETYQILLAIKDKTYGWQNHPAKKMWEDSPIGLAEYGIIICEEWINRGYKDTTLPKIRELYDYFIQFSNNYLPDWFYSSGEKLFQSHRKALLYKDYSFYKNVFPNDIPELNYYWPK